MDKKLIFITALSTLVIVIVAFIAFESFRYLKLKNDCIKNSVPRDGYSFSIYFNPEVLQTDIDTFANKIRGASGIISVSVESKDEALQSFKNENRDNTELLEQLEDLGSNPLSASITIKSNLSDIDAFINLEKDIFAQAQNYGLAIARYSDGRLNFLQAELAKIEGAFLSKDFFKFIFSGEGNHFFEKNYSQICNPAFKSNILQ